jgi:membrane fusion protein, copper/silver efflux system
MRGHKFLFVGVTVLAAAGSGWALERYVFKGSDPLSHLRSSAGHQDDRTILYWVAPMDPNYRREGPGKSPMGMDLIPVYEGTEPEEPGVVRVSAAAAAAIGVRTATAQRETLTPEIRTFGRVAYDERRTRHIHVRADGWVDRLNVRREGERVRKGDLLFTYFAPDLAIAAMEYTRELERGDQRGITATRLKLRSLGVSEQQIAGLRPGPGIVENIEVYAPQDGVVAAIDVAEGMFISPETSVFSLSDLSRVWVLAEVSERDIPRVREGMTATIDAGSGFLSQRSGIVETVFPALRQDTRTIELRLVLDNADGALHPHALTRVALQGDPIENVLTVPASAVIRLGDGARVVRVLDEGRFKPVPVALGPRIGERIVIEEGVEEGARIVAAAHFLIDSESSLQNGVDRMAAHGAHDHEAHGQPAPATGESASGDQEGELVWAEGTIVAIEADRRVVTLDHAPVPALGWPRMVMDFRVATDVAIENLKVDDAISFGFVQTPEGRYEIRDVRPDGHESGHDAGHESGSHSGPH